MLDLRTPSGWFFLIIGLILCVRGILSPDRAPLGDANVNLWSGLPMLLFGALMLLLARRRA